MRSRKTLVSVLFTLIVGLSFVTSIGWAKEQISPFPSFGRGPVEVRLYTNYFCPPCREMEPAVEPLLKDLLKRNAIRLILVDVSHPRLTPIFAQYFLFALKRNNDPEHAFLVKSILLEASTDKEMATQERIEALLKEKNIPFSVFDTKPLFDRYDALFKQDKIEKTPTCVIIKGGQKKVSVGKADIIGSLKAL
jgi:thiol-disulfide isomerase/thioredoxin